MRVTSSGLRSKVPQRIEGQGADVPDRPEPAEPKRPLARERHASDGSNLQRRKAVGLLPSATSETAATASAAAVPQLDVRRSLVLWRPFPPGAGSGDEHGEHNERRAQDEELNPHG